MLGLIGPQTLHSFRDREKMNARSDSVPNTILIEAKATPAKPEDW